MGIDINGEIAKASAVMSLYRMSADDQIKVTRILLDAGVEHCLQEQEKVRTDKDARIAKASKSYRGLVH